ncbi:AbgT family transporter [Solirubrobacter phytolaccae]|uniref:AbgT family transporter n=1 Tax=Solirubrobacter phytolaccae TaxID=1404360 RepID=A0A9X3NB19_9ACTN|nr:AbgT family transporter [Solirubrobacter phytolaccae]MDA0183163.1 AbgT family transporter [Solirubrobacter phytolaccae]
MADTLASPAPSAPPHTRMQRMLDGIERLGNKMPDPAILFLWLCVGVIVLSQLLAWLDVDATYQVVEPPPATAEETYYGGSTDSVYVGPTEHEPADDYQVREKTTEVEGLLTGDGVRFLFTSFVDNFRNFAAVAIILVVMIGVGLAEAAGLIGALIRKLVAVSSSSTLTFIIVLLGMISSVASDAGYIVLIPLGAVAFKSVGRNPLAGIAAAFAGVAAGFGVNFLITPLDGVLTEITNDASALVDPDANIDLAANLYFGIVSALFVTIVLTFVSSRMVESRMGPWDASQAGEQPEDEPVVDKVAEARGLRYALWATLAVVAVIALLTAIPGAPLQDPETGRVIGDSPFMDSLIVIIAVIFLAAGLAYGRGAGTIKTSAEILASITKSWAGMASLLFLFLLIAQFIAYFSYSNMAEVAAVSLGDVLEQMDIGAVWLLLGFMLVTMVVDLIMPAAIAKWAILAPIFIPLLIRLDVTPQTVLAAYRVADSPLNVLTPLMAYFPLIVVFVQRYNRQAGIGTVVSLMLPFVVVLSIAWTAFFVVWYLLGVPLGPGSPVHP